MQMRKVSWMGAVVKWTVSNRGDTTEFFSSFATWAYIARTSTFAREAGNLNL